MGNDLEGLSKKMEGKDPLVKGGLV